MGLIRSLLTLPVSGPMQGSLWLARKIHETAESEINDPVAIRRALGSLEADLEAGRIDEATYDAAEEVLMTRLERGQG